MCAHKHTHRGIQQVLIKRLKHRLRQDAIRSDPSAPWDLRCQTESNPYGLDYLCILDFEATCEAENPPDYVHEIIEFPVLLLNLKTLQVVSHSVVRYSYGYKLYHSFNIFLVNCIPGTSSENGSASSLFRMMM